MTDQITNEDTLPTPIGQEPKEKPRKKSRVGIVLLGLLVVLLGAGFGGYLGYRAGLQDRLNAQQEQRVMLASQQYQLGVLDMEAGRYENARKRFEYVISIDPNFPGVADQLAKTMMEQALLLTPTAQPTPTAEPTPDLRGEEDLFNQIKNQLLNQDWAGAIETIEALRNLNLEYRAVEVDGMYYIALRFLGVQNILSQGELEVGIYNLTLSERFAPLDVDASNYRTWARQYLSAASFWGIDWAQVVAYFAEIYPSLPNLRDSSGVTATERFRIASINYGDLLMTQEKYCDAQIQYDNALMLGSDPTVGEKSAKAAEYCSNPPNQEAPPPVQTTVSPTPTTEGQVTPTEVTPSPEPTQETTPEPTSETTP